LVDARGPLGKRLDAGYCEQAIREGGVATFDLELRTAAGALIWLNVSVLVFEPLRVSPALVLHLAHDITASRRRRALYERLRETSREIAQLVDDERHLVPVSPLTQQEQRLLTLLARGRTPPQVARELDISAQTFRNHLYHVNQKLGTHNRLEAVVHATRRRLI
jgi:DNA-binding CsgD family transcriptional regulator